MQHYHFLQLHLQYAVSEISEIVLKELYLFQKKIFAQYVFEFI